MSAVAVAGCLSDREIPECYKDPAYRDSVLLANNVTSYEKDTKQEVLDDMRDALLKYGDETAVEEGAPALAYDGINEGVSEDDLRFLSYVYKEYAELAVISEYAYKDTEVPLPEGWTDLGLADAEVASIIDQYAEDGVLSIGLKCSLLSKDDRYVLAFAGTDLPSDWKDFNQVLSFLKDAYENVTGAFRDDAFQVNIASALVEKLIAAGKVSVDSLEFTGHSLGGRLACEMSVRYARPAVVFNAAGVAPSLYGKYEATRADAPDGWKGYIVDITSANDMLTRLQKFATGLSENRDYRSIGAHLHLSESMTGHAIAPLSASLYARSEACKNELKSR